MVVTTELCVDKRKKVMVVVAVRCVYGKKDGNLLKEVV